MKKLTLMLSLWIALISCKHETKQNGENQVTAESSETIEPINEWFYLFDGTTTEGWRAYNGDDLPPQWIIKDGVLTFDTEKRTEESRKGGKDIIYAAQEFDNFELAWEWKIPEGGNSGLLYHIQEGDWGIPEISPEYQMLDDLKWEEINDAKLEEWQKTGADYAMHLPDVSQKIVKPAGEWNTSRIIFTPAKVEHWLNGKNYCLLCHGQKTGRSEKERASGKTHLNMALLKKDISVFRTMIVRFG